MIINNPSGAWGSPHGEDQFSHGSPLDTAACVSYSTVHCIESFLLHFGIDMRFSERFLAKMSGTDPTGNSITNVYNALKKYGLVLDQDWPEPETFTWAEYYAAIPPEIVAKGQNLFKYVKIGALNQWLKANVADQLKVCPMQIWTPSGTTSHFREIISQTQVFDSYPPYLEPMPATALGYYQIELIFNLMNQAKVVQSKNTPTVYVCYPVGDMTYLNEKANLEGFVVPAPIPSSDSL